MDFESIHLLIIALLPSVGTLIGALVMFFKIVTQFKGLRKEVKDDKVIDNILKQNRALVAQNKKLLEKIDELTDKIESMAVANEDLAQSIKNDKEA